MPLRRRKPTPCPFSRRRRNRPRGGDPARRRHDRGANRKDRARAKPHSPRARPCPLRETDDERARLAAAVRRDAVAGRIAARRLRLRANGADDLARLPGLVDRDRVRRRRASSDSTISWRSSDRPRSGETSRARCSTRPSTRSRRSPRFFRCPSRSDSWSTSGA